MAPMISLEGRRLEVDVGLIKLLRWLCGERNDNMPDRAARNRIMLSVKHCRLEVTVMQPRFDWERAVGRWPTLRDKVWRFRPRTRHIAPPQKPRSFPMT
jgi:hypothetical protein